MPQLKIRGTDPTAITEMKYRETPIWQVLGVANAGPSPVGSSFNKSFFSCPREHALRHECKIESAKIADPLSLGLAWHLLLEYYYRRLMDGASQSEALKRPFEVIETLEQHPEYKDMGDKLRRMIDAYLENYETSDKWKVLAVEETLIYRGEIDYSARLDLVIEDLERGGLWAVEHKSARQLSLELLDNYQLDLQILGQVWLMEHCVDLSKYPDFKGVRVNIVTTGNKIPKCARTEVYPSRAHLQAFYESVKNWPYMRALAARIGWPQALGHCGGYARGYSRCEFFDICHNRPEMSVADWQKITSDEELPLGFQFAKYGVVRTTAEELV